MEFISLISTFKEKIVKEFIIFLISILVGLSTHIWLNQNVIQSVFWGTLSFLILLSVKRGYKNIKAKKILREKKKRKEFEESKINENIVKEIYVLWNASQRFRMLLAKCIENELDYTVVNKSDYEISMTDYEYIFAGRKNQLPEKYEIKVKDEMREFIMKVLRKAIKDGTYTDYFGILKQKKFE